MLKTRAELFYKVTKTNKDEKCLLDSISLICTGKALFLKKQKHYIDVILLILLSEWRFYQKKSKYDLKMEILYGAILNATDHENAGSL